MLAVVPITPGGLGVIEVAAASLLITFGLPRGIATFGVLGWRLVNFWLPIPLGMLAYLAMVLPHDLSRRSRSGAGRPGPAPPKDAVDDSSAA